MAVPDVTRPRARLLVEPEVELMPNPHRAELLITGIGDIAANGARARITEDMEATL